MAEATPSGSGGQLPPLEPATDGSMRIRGGVGGISFQLEELMAGVAELDGMADELAAVEIGVRRIWEELCPYENDPRTSGTAALIAVGEGGQAVRAVREELQHLSSQVRASRRDYETAESLAAAGIRMPDDGWGFLPALYLDLKTTFVPSRDAAEALAAPLSLALMIGISPAELARALAAEVAAGRGFLAIGPLMRRLAEGTVPSSSRVPLRPSRNSPGMWWWTPRPPASSPGFANLTLRATERSRWCKWRPTAEKRISSSSPAPSPGIRQGFEPAG